jgi:4'-phosphopantetheinyl transferase
MGFSMTIWQHPAEFPSLKNQQVHLWRANLTLSNLKIEELMTYLSPDEVVRANKFRFAQHKSRFIAARGILRQLLGNYLEVSPCSLTFTYSDRGKPQLPQNSLLQFNLSHSEEYGLFGFTLNHLIGVDLEYQRAMPDALKIAQRFFSDREFKMLTEVPQEQQPRLFFQLWTAKEAYLKAIGTGLSGSLASIEISVDKNHCFYLSPDQGDQLETKHWSLYSCTPEINYSGAIAINSGISEQQIYYWHWSPNLSC